MNESEMHAHTLVKRLNYLLFRLEKEFFHIHPSMEENGKTTSLALTSILNEALNLHEASFKTGNFWVGIREWGRNKDWNWEDIEIRFTFWPELSVIKPFSINADGQLIILGRDENNSSKHYGELAKLESVLNACAAAWFIVLEVARESEIFLDLNQAEDLMKLFDCFELIDIGPSSYGIVVSRPIRNRVSYPSVRGISEIHLAKDAFEKRCKLT